MTRSVPGGQRGSSKDPAETSALWGNNSATFHHFIIMSLYWTQLRTHEAHEGKDRKWATEKHEERGVYRGTRGSWSFKQGEVWIMKFKKVSHNNGLIPTYETNKKQTDQRTQQKREKQTENQTHAEVESLWCCFQCDIWVSLLIRNLHFLFEQDRGFQHHLLCSVVLIWCGTLMSDFSPHTAVIITALITCCFSGKLLSCNLIPVQTQRHIALFKDRCLQLKKENDTFLDGNNVFTLTLLEVCPW